MAKIVALFLLIFLSFAITVFCMVNGYGLEIKNWGWLIFGFLANFTISSIVLAISNE